MDDIGSRLRLGDHFARAGRFAEAVEMYLSVGLEFADLGFALKAVATLRQVVFLIDRHVPHLADARLRALQSLCSLYTELGLTEDASATRELLGPRDWDVDA